MNTESLKATLAIVRLESETYISPVIADCKSAAEAVARLEQMRSDLDPYIQHLKVIRDNDEVRNDEVRNDEVRNGEVLSIRDQMAALTQPVQLVLLMGGGNYAMTLKLLEAAQKENDRLLAAGKWDTDSKTMDCALDSKTDFPKAIELLKKAALLDGVSL